MSDRPTPETDDQPTINAINDNGYQVPCVDIEYARKLERERDEARVQLAAAKREAENLATSICRAEYSNVAPNWGLCDSLAGVISQIDNMYAGVREMRDEAGKELSSIHRWIERNHADGFIDSLTYLQNLERVTDSWYDRIDAIETDARRFVRERDEAREESEQQARLLGISAEREYALRGKIFELERKILQLETK